MILFIYRTYPLLIPSHVRQDLLFMIELAQSSLDLLVILLHLRQGTLDVLQRCLVIWLFDATGFILAGAVVLDLFARFLDLAQAQCRGRTFEEVAQGGEFGEVFFFAVDLLLECGYAMQITIKVTYSASSILSKVLSAWSKNP